jgi:hypothetical protein
VSDASAASEPVCTEDSAVVLLRTASAVLGSLTFSQVAAGRRNRLWFELDEADLEWLATGRHSQ